MKILHVCLDYLPRRTRYGSAIVTDDLLAELARCGHDVRILTPGRPERGQSLPRDPRLVEVPTGLSLRHLLPADRPTEMFSSAAAIVAWNDAAATWLRRCQPFGSWAPDVIGNDGWTTQVIADAAAARFGCPMVTTAHVVDRHYAAVRTRPERPDDALFRAAEEYSFVSSSSVVVPSRTARDLAVLYYPEYAQKLRVVPHGLDWSTVDAAVADAAGPDAEFVTVVYLGRISSERGWEPFLSAFLAAAQLNERLRLRVIGDGTSLPAARERYRHPAIQFLGGLPRAEVLRELCRADIFCNPALMETFGIAELEALGLGRCVISNTGVGKHSHVEHLRTGVSVPILPSPRAHLDETAWTRWLLRLAADPQQRRRLGDAARTDARHRYDVFAMTADLLHEFQSAIDDKVRQYTPGGRDDR